MLGFFLQKGKCVNVLVFLSSGRSVCQCAVFSLPSGRSSCQCAGVFPQVGQYAGDFPSGRSMR